MMTRIVLVWLIVVSFSAAADLKVRVVNGSRDSLAVAGAHVEVISFSAASPEPVIIAQQTTAADGWVSFHFLPPDTGSSFYLSSLFSGVRYYSEEFSAAKPPSPATIVVFDTTLDLGSFSVPMHHLIIEEAEGRLHIRETHVLQNSGKLTIVPKADEAFLRIALPSGFSNFASLTHDFELTVESNTLAVRGNLPPGNRALSFSYAVSAAPKQILLPLQFSAPTRNLDLFILAESWSPVSPALQDLGSFVIRGKSYRRFHGEGFSSGQTISVVLRKKGQNGKGISPFLTMMLAFLLLSGGFLTSRAKAKAAPKRLKQR